jgi:hypothetical protein
MRALLIDDLRNIDADRVARTYDDGIEALTNEGPWGILFLDHDLGDPDPKKTGLGIMNFLEANLGLLPRRIFLVTSNPVGRQQMEVIIRKLYRRE